MVGAAGIALETRIFGEIGAVEHACGEGRPFAVVLQAEQHARRRPCRRAVGIDRGVAGAVARRRLGAVHREIHRKAHPFGHRLQHRDLDVVADAGAAALDQRGQDRVVGGTCRRRCRRSRCRPWPSRPACRSPTGSPPRPGSADRRPCVSPVRPAVAVAGDRASDQPGMCAAQRSRPRPSRSAAPGREVLHEHVGLGEQARQRCRSPPASSGRARGFPSTGWSRRNGWPARARACRRRGRNRRRPAARP